MKMDAIERLKRQTYYQYHYEDGITDILLGIVVFCFSIEFRFSSFMALLPIVIITLKRVITKKRLGHVEFLNKPKEKKIAAAFLCFASLCMIDYFYYHFGTFYNSTEMLRALHPFLYATLSWLFFIVISVSLPIKRFFLWSILLYAPFVVSFIQQDHYRFAQNSLSVVGIIIFLTGIYQMLRFIRKYPIPNEDTVEN